MTLWSVLLVIGICFSCENEDSVSKRLGQFSLRLSADTTAIMKDMSSGLTKSVASELEDFANIADYTVLVMKEKDTVVHYKRFDQMPASISLAEGAYQLIAKKGDDLPAEFLNPYFEGSTSFTIKEQMNTPLELTCTLANARVTVDYTNDFLEAYDEYTALLSTPFTTADVELPKGETRAVYLQVASGGTQLAVGIKLKKKTETTAKTYWMQTPINLARRQNVHLIFKTDGEALEGIGLQVLLDKESWTEKLTFTTTIPDFMWQQFKEPTLEAVAFENGETVSKLSGQYRGMQIGVSMKAGIQALYMKYWKDDEEDAAEIIDLVQEKEKAIDTYHLTWLNSVTHDRNGDLGGATLVQIDLSSLIAELAELENRELYHHFTFYGVDQTPKQQESNELNFVIKAAVSNAPEIDLELSENMQVVEGNALDEEIGAVLRVDDRVEFEEVTLTINEETYSLKSEKDLAKLSDRHVVATYYEDYHLFGVKFEKAFTSLLNAGQYTIQLTVKDSDGNSTTVSKSFVVKDPNVQLLSTEEDAFAKRIVLRASMEEGAQKDKLRFEYLADGSTWQTIPNMHIKADGQQWVDTLRGLSPETGYQVRAVYLSMDIDNVKTERISEVQSLLTEKEDYAIPNSGFEHWYSEKTDKDGNPITKNVNKVYWDKWFPWNQSDLSTKAWNTVNQITTQDGAAPTVILGVVVPPYVGCCYVANSGTIPTEDAEGTAQSAALIRTVGWGSGSTGGGSESIIKRLTPGELYLGDCVNLEPKYGIDFASRPTGFSFDYKYETKSGSDDKFVAEIVVYARDGSVIATAQLPEGSCGSNASWSKAEVRLNYSSNAGRNKAAKLCIRFKSSSSTNKDYLEANLMKYPPFANLSDGESVGSQLYIDNVELIYE